MPDEPEPTEESISAVLKGLGLGLTVIGLLVVSILALVIKGG